MPLSTLAPMCGIMGYIGEQQAHDILINGLERLEYRGYDSAGTAIISPALSCPRLKLNKVVGRVEKLKGTTLLGHVGIAHTRWATHGAPNLVNAHPHCDCSGKLSVVHNGIIENYLEIKNKLHQHTFASQTDTEVVAHLIEEHYKTLDKKTPRS